MLHIILQWTDVRPINIGGRLSSPTKTGDVYITGVSFLWSPYVIGQTIIFLPCDFYLLSMYLLLFVFPRLISAAADWMSTILLHMAWP